MVQTEYFSVTAGMRICEDIIKGTDGALMDGTLCLHNTTKSNLSLLARKPGSWVRIPLRALMFDVCVRFSVFRQRPCDELITRPRSPTVCKMIKKLGNQPYAPKWEQDKKNVITLLYVSLYNFC
jgi:hypothetical protein